MAIVFELAPELRDNFPYLEPPKDFDPLESDMVRPPCAILKRADEVDPALTRATNNDTKCVKGLALLAQPLPDGNQPITVTAFSLRPSIQNCRECIVFRRYGYLMNNSGSISIPQPAHP